MTQLVKNIAKAPLWKRYVLSALLGVFAALAQSPVNFFPALLVAYPVLILLLERSPNPSGAFLTGWIFGFGYFLACFHWVPYVLIDDLQKWWWAIMAVLILLPLVLSFFSGALVGLFYHCFFREKTAMIRIVAFAGLWALMEWVRSHTFTGLPGGLIGYSWAFSDMALQITSVIGIYGLSLISVLLFSLPYFWFAGENKHKKPALVLSLALLAALFGYGTLRLINADVSYHPDIRLRLVQTGLSSPIPKMGELEKWRNFREHLLLSQMSADEPFQYLIWPEAALTYTDFETDEAVRDALKQIIPKNGFLLTGWMSKARDVNDRDFYNNLVVLDQDIGTVAQHKKFHLVPIGEYGLFRGLFKGSRSITVLNADTLPGPGPSTLHVKGLPAFSPLICYEIAFPAAVINKQDRPQWILNITNDNWFGRSAGPYQHLAIARTRAIEEGLPLVRAAVSGISAVTDAYGRILKILSVGQKSILDTPLPTALDRPTFYSKYGDIPFLALVILCLFWQKARFRRA